MVNVPPPLLCSTPPPIDFGEDDDDSGLQSTLQLEDGDADEYSEYGLVTDTHEAALNAKVHTLPELPISSEKYSAQPLPPDLSNGHAKTAAKQTVEAFNYQVKAPDYDHAEEQEIPTKEDNAMLAQQNELAALTEPQREELEDEEEEEEANTNDNVPSLKLDSLSLYSSESVTPPCTLSPVADDRPTKAPTLSHQVTLEDVSDDSDEECSPKKPKELFIPEGAADFFAIEIVEKPLTQQKAPALHTQTPVAAKHEPAFAAIQETPPIDTPMPELNGNVVDRAAIEVEDDDDFGDFADFDAAPMAATPATATPASAEPQQPASQEDGFDDFQDFATPATTTATATHETDEDDDDFGDFAEPAFVSTPAAVTTVLSQPPPPTTAHLSITERVKPVLELMFPSLESSSAQSTAKQEALAQTQTLHFGAIEQAHALDYQWASSEMRHSLVRSLAIDSRNILFGDKWNASMPRFAANLSFDPLKPLKPLSATSVGAGATSSVLDPQQATVSSWQLTNSSTSFSQQPLQGLEATAAAAQTSQAKAQPGPAHGQGANNDADAATAAATLPAALPDDAPAAASVFAAAATAAPLSPALSADGHGHNFDDSEQLAQQQQQQQEQQHQQQLNLRESPSPSTSSPSPPPVTVSSQQLHEVASNSSGSNSFTLPLKETHIYTPSKSDTAVAKTTTLAPIDFDYEIASAGIIIDETVVKKEYRDVEYKPPPYALDSPSKLSAGGKPSAEDDDFSDFQCVPAVKTAAQLQPPRNGTPTFGEQMILSPAILLPQSIPMAKPSIEWGDSALANINAEELARIEELFSHQYKPPTISATVAQQSPKQPRQQRKQQQEDDEWSDFVSVPVQQQQQQLQLQQQNYHNNQNNNVQKPRQAATAAAAAPTKEDDWSDFVSSTPMPARAAPQFNSGAWQSANFYNNPLSFYQQQQQPHAHSNLVPKYQSGGSSTSNNNNNNNNNTPQQIHMMHDFSTAPTATATAAPATYQHQHHQHHQQQLQQQQQQHRQQFHLGNAKVAPRISLIPDLSFVAPALPTNAGAFMSSLPKPSFSAKK